MDIDHPISMRNSIKPLPFIKMIPINLTPFIEMFPIFPFVYTFENHFTWILFENVISMQNQIICRISKHTSFESVLLLGLISFDKRSFNKA